MTMQINGTSGLVFNDASTQNTAATGFGFKNRIINGAMMIDQRNAGASVTNQASRVYTLDRWASLGSASSKFTVQQSSVAPAGFVNSLLVTSSAATSVGSSDYYFMQQFIEGFNIADLGWGTANAQPVTLSFQVRSSLTGTFGGALQNNAQDRSYPFSYTISAANTWETKTVTIAGDTTGTWLTTNGRGISLIFGLGIGSTFSGTAGSWSGNNFFGATGATSVVGTNGATFYITGVQLEKGSTATSFDYRPYGTELALCQRYCQAFRSSDSVNKYTNLGFGVAQGSTQGVAYRPLGVSMRTTPSVTASGAFVAYNGNSIVAVTTGPAIDAAATNYSFVFVYDTAGGLTVTNPNSLLTSSAGTGIVFLTAEL